MKFRTEINLDKSKHPIDHDEKIVTIGSCFAQNIGEYFEHFRFNAISNPFGVLYNPISILNSFNLALDRKEFKKKDLIESGAEWHSFFHHSDFSHHDPNVCLEMINKGIISTFEFLKSTDVVIITFGTAYVYRHIEKDFIVSNDKPEFHLNPGPGPVAVLPLIFGKGNPDHQTVKKHDKSAYGECKIARLFRRSAFFLHGYSPNW